MGKRKTKKPNRPPLRAIGRAVGCSHVHAYLIISGKRHGSKETEKAIHDYIREWRARRKAA